MKPTPRESAAALRLAESLIEFIVAVDEGIASRRASRSRDEIRVKVDQSPLPIPPEPVRVIAPQKPEQVLLTARDAAKRLNISDRMLWSMSAPNGPIPTVRMGRRVLYSVRDLDMVIDRLRTKPR